MGAGRGLRGKWRYCKEGGTEGRGGMSSGRLQAPAPCPPGGGLPGCASTHLDVPAGRVSPASRCPRTLVPPLASPLLAVGGNVGETRQHLTTNFNHCQPLAGGQGVPEPPRLGSDCSGGQLILRKWAWVDFLDTVNSEGLNMSVLASPLETFDTAAQIAHILPSLTPRTGIREASQGSPAIPDSKRGSGVCTSPLP